MILHIPHSGTDVLDYPVDQEQINLATDWFTDELFTHVNSDCIVQKHSRLIVDCERLRDEFEPLFECGQGIVPTTDFYGNSLPYELDKPRLLNIYNSHHNALNALVRKTLCYIPVVYVVDCHSFGVQQITNQNQDYDFCIGYNDDFNSFGLLERLTAYIESNGYTVGINAPFSNAIVPSDFNNNEQVKSIMIEVNKRLYLTDDYQKSDKFESIKYFVTNLLQIVSEEEISCE